MQLGTPSVATTRAASTRPTEIVITRNGTNFARDCGAARDRRNPNQRRRSVRTAEHAGGDTIQIIGDFSGTSLRLNTITIDGEAGDDTIDISALTSAHRIVFRSNGGNDTIIGALRAEDVIELPEGADISTYNLVENEQWHQDHHERNPFGHLHGVVPPQFQTDEPDDDEDDNGETAGRR